jgi:alkyl hydroperoxide reductase subunit AhpC
MEYIANETGVTERALFVLDSDGIIRWSYVSPIGFNSGAEGTLKALESIDKSRERKNESK